MDFYIYIYIFNLNDYIIFNSPEPKAHKMSL